jgi:hypothetical protein
MATNQQTIAAQMLAQLRLLDPSISAEVGTPERKILDTVAEALADVQIDLTQLTGALDVDAKSGSNLDNFLALFGFGRQQATKATGFVTFSRIAAGLSDIVIPAGTQLAANVSTDTGVPIYETSYQVVLRAGQLAVAAPVQAIYAGAFGNVGINQVTRFASTTVFGIDQVTNEAIISGGTDSEDDDELKIRFKNTIFRNLAGTQDQYLALAASAQYVSKANVVGPISRYREYIQVPPVDDSSSYDVNPSGGILESGNGTANQYTTALSTIPYSKHTYDTVPNFVSSGTDATDVYYREEVDWTLNTEALEKNRGDAYRFWNSSGGAIGPDPNATPYAPSVTFMNVYTGSLGAVTAVRPGDILLFEHSYMSTASRNDWTKNISNCVDVFVNGSNDLTASTVVPSPGTSTAMTFVASPTSSKFYANNYRRFGQPDVTPTAGNLFIPLFWQPVTGLPESIAVVDADVTTVYFLNEHYWLVEDVTELHGTVRARNGIEWNLNAITGKGASAANDENRNGLVLNGYDQNTPIEIVNYVYDKNIVDLQYATEASKQVTTDVLVHKARLRYFQFDITVMYTRGSNPFDVNASIQAGLATYFNGTFFGGVIQLSDVLQVIHSVSGIDNVRWSSDIPGFEDLDRVTETDYYGQPRVGLTYSTDFFLKDDELPSLPQFINGTQDILEGVPTNTYAQLPGLIIRSRAQNTWIRA